MGNKKLFHSLRGWLTPATDAVNEEHSPAYRFSPEAELAQYTATGCLNSTFYAGATDQLATVLQLSNRVDAEFVALTAIYCRERGFMKDMPALLCALLSVRDKALFGEIFPRVIDNGKMLRTFVQIMRSGAVGRKSLGTAPKRMVRNWLEARDDETLFKSSLGQSPSMADVIKMVHPRPKTKSREALLGYLIGKDHKAEALPVLVREFEDFKRGAVKEVPDVPFQMLTALDLAADEWTAIACSECALADDANELEHVRAPRRIRKARYAGNDRESTARSEGDPGGEGVSLSASCGACDGR